MRLNAKALLQLVMAIALAGPAMADEMATAPPPDGVLKEPEPLYSLTPLPGRPESDLTVRTDTIGTDPFGWVVWPEYTETTEDGAESSMTIEFGNGTTQAVGSADASVEAEERVGVYASGDRKILAQDTKSAFHLDMDVVYMGMPFSIWNVDVSAGARHEADYEHAWAYLSIRHLGEFVFRQSQMTYCAVCRPYYESFPELIEYTFDIYGIPVTLAAGLGGGTSGSMAASAWTGGQGQAGDAPTYVGVFIGGSRRGYVDHTAEAFVDVYLFRAGVRCTSRWADFEGEAGMYVYPGDAQGFYKVNLREVAVKLKIVLEVNDFVGGWEEVASLTIVDATTPAHNVDLIELS